MATAFMEPGGDATFDTSLYQTAVGPPTIVTDHVNGSHIKSMRFTGTQYGYRGDVLASKDTGRLSFYVYIAALPAAGAPLFEVVVKDSPNNIVPGFGLSSGGALSIFDVLTGSTVGSTGSTLSTGTWYRLTFCWNVTSTTVNEFRVYLNGALDLSLSNGTFTTLDFGYGAGVREIYLGNPESKATLDVRLSDIYVDDSSSTADIGDVMVTAKRPNANGTTNGFTTQIGAGGSGYGSGHSPQVNERALSATNGWSMVGAGAATTEEYNVEGAATGDIDISGKTLVDWMGWVRAKSSGSQTASIVVGGASSNISLTTTTATFLNAKGSTTYPAGSGTDIGIVTTTALQTVSLYECGVMVAYLNTVPPSGAIAATLAPITASAAGSEKDPGSIAATLAVVTASATGSEKATGAIAATLAPVTADAAGAEKATGAIAATLASLAVAAAATARVPNQFVSASVVIDWAGNGITAPTPESIDDVSAYVVGTISVRRGRARITDEIAAGTATFTLRNTDGRFTLLNTSSPLYPYNGYPARYCEINVTYNGTSYPIISGTVSIESQNTADQTVTCTLVDHFERFRLKLSSLAIQTGKRVDEILTAILDDPNVADPYPKVFDTGPETIGYFTDHNRRLDNALILAAKQDPGGIYFVDRSGNHVYHNRHHAALASTYATFTGNFDSLDPQVKQEDLADTVRATYPALAVDSSFGVVYSQNIFVACPPGTTTFDFEVNASGVSGASGYVTPLTATTDYVANSESNGSGTSKTGQVTITITSSDSNGGTLSVVNADSSYVYLTSLQVRGYALRQSEVVNAVKVTTTSPVVTGQDIRREFEFQDNLGVVRAWVNREAAVRSGMHVRPILKFAPDTDALMATALGGELNAKVQVTDASAAWLTYVDDLFTIQGIELNINAPDSRRPPVEATWKLFDAQMSGINQFIIGRSTIASTAGDPAYDWIGV